ncbi:MAG: hypothetical protein VX709_02300, partial [Pseudomonadota bacterium]|nr:hypothetical protein [Pseudomonadota bacterium]
MRIIKSLLAGFLLAALSFSVRASQYQEPFQDKALELLRHSITMRTADGFGLVPELASYLAAELKLAGFDPQDIHLLPMGRTAALVVRYPGDGSAG